MQSFLKVLVLISHNILNLVVVVLCNFLFNIQLNIVFSLLDTIDALNFNVIC